MLDWETIQPKVNSSAEFLEIASDFGDPMELFREALHNAYDWGATEFSININVENISGQDKLVIELIDNGSGMDKDTIINNFWNLGDSKSKENSKSIGEKGHGTKIYLRSDEVIVHTSDGNKFYESVCKSAFSQLNSGNVHCPLVRESEVEYPKGTSIKIIGYNNDQRAKLKQDIVKDYLYWFTVLGTVEPQFENRTIRDFKVYLKALDVDEAEELHMGHPFAKENNNINKLFDEHGETAADYFVKKYVYQNQTLESMPEIKFDVVIYYEGDEAKRDYNNMIRMRSSRTTGSYKVSDRYGIWLCKDYVPIQRVNEWITSFGKGSNSYGLLHGFINCQKLKLTANRGTIANTNQKVIDELRMAVQKIINEIDIDLYKNEIFTLMKWKEEAKTQSFEAAAFEKRKQLVTQKQYFKIGERVFLTPRNEAELYGLFISLYTLHPEHFEFEPLDYDESAGIDLLARNKTTNKIADCTFWYVELKYQLGATEFNHSFSNIRYIVCWELASKIKDGSILKTSVEDVVRELHIIPGEDGKMKKYYLDSDESSIKIKVICLKEYILEKLNIQLLDQN